jgi:hypothetical protein
MSAFIASRAGNIRTAKRNLTNPPIRATSSIAADIKPGVAVGLTAVPSLAAEPQDDLQIHRFSNLAGLEGRLSPLSQLCRGDFAVRGKARAATQ